MVISKKPSGKFNKKEKKDPRLFFTKKFKKGTDKISEN